MKRFASVARGVKKPITSNPKRSRVSLQVARSNRDDLILATAIVEMAGAKNVSFSRDPVPDPAPPDFRIWISERLASFFAGDAKIA
jgi:hypothetical protein